MAAIYIKYRHYALECDLYFTVWTPFLSIAICLFELNITLYGTALWGEVTVSSVYIPFTGVHFLINQRHYYTHRGSKPEVDYNLDASMSLLMPNRGPSQYKDVVLPE